jgi:hypothetical protein
MTAGIEMVNRFRGFLPVIIDVETGGFNAKTDALLEIAAVLVRFDADGLLRRDQTVRYHVKPFDGANMDPASLAVNGIVPDHPLRPAIDERDALLTRSAVSTLPRCAASPSGRPCSPGPSPQPGSNGMRNRRIQRLTMPKSLQTFSVRSSTGSNRFTRRKNRARSAALRRD